VNKKEEW